MEPFIDLSKPLGHSVQIYEQGDYRDPEFSCSKWCTIEEHGYSVSALAMGTQTGTHIDAPAHFDSAGSCLDALSLDKLIGSYYLVDLPAKVNSQVSKAICASYAQESLLFMRCLEFGHSLVAGDALELLLALPPAVWVLDGEVDLSDAAPLEFHRLLARAGKFLVENLDSQAARKVRPGGELFALPLPLIGASGSPCRVVVRNRR